MKSLIKTPASVLLLASGLYAGHALGQQCEAPCTRLGIWQLCSPQPVDLSLQNLAAKPTDGDVLVDADRIDVSDPNLSILEGNVELHDGERALRAERAVYDQASETVRVDNGVRFGNQDMQIVADDLVVDLARDAATAHGASYQLLDRRGQGQAAKIEQAGGGTSYLSDVTYSTCDVDQQDWFIRAREMELDHDSATGVARGVTLRLKSTPIFYLPYASFPLDDSRKSGWLVPSVGYSNDNGFELEAPYYINIAPNMDATLVPGYMSERGFMLGGQYRYLGEGTRGQLDVDYLPDDDLAQRDRGFGQFVHNTRFNDYFSVNANLQHVSDDQYFEDFGQSLYDVARRVLPSSAQLVGNGELWSTAIELNHFQSIDPLLPQQREPYNRLPRVTFFGELPSTNGFRTTIDAEYAHFDRDVGITGGRIDLFPNVNYTYRTGAGFISGDVGYRLTQYDLDSTGPDPDRELPIASLDGGLFFDRPLQFSGSDWLQTLEPRFFYLYAPYRDQSDLPLFDTRALTYGVPTLFSNNRFVGADRQGDANQVSLALTSRLLNSQTGHELLTATVGQIYYFDDRRVQLNRNAGPETSSTSPLIAELDYRPFERWTASLGLHWDFDDDQADYGLARLQYLDGNRLANVSYRMRRDSIDQFDVSAIWPVGENWRLIGRYNYSLEDNELLEAMAGFAYDGCCWAVRLLARQYVTERLGPRREGIFLEFVFKGLGSVGRDPGRLLENSILGYNDYRDINGW